MQNGISRGRLFPSTVFNGSVDANTVSTESNLDGPSLSAVNSTSYEWWYFDAVSPDLESAITIVFYTALSSGFGLLPPSSDVAVISMDFLFPNGTSRSVDLAATEAVITTIDQGSSAVYKGAGAQWQGAPDLSSYIVSIDSPKSGVVGTFKLKSRAPALFPRQLPPFPSGLFSTYGSWILANKVKLCMRQGRSWSTHDGRTKYWSGQTPSDAVGDVDFYFNGEKLCFQGAGYHDHVGFLLTAPPSY